MAEKLYSYDDLIWEAVRRNHDYRDYYDSLKDANGMITFKGWDPYFSHRWQMKQPFDYEISVDTIKTKIKNKEMTIEQHPYFNYFESKRDTVETETIPKRQYSYRESIRVARNVEDNERLIKWAVNFITRNDQRLIISIDPFENEESVIKNVIQAKRSASSSLKKQLGLVVSSLEKRMEEEKHFHKICHLYYSMVYKKDIFNYIEQLETYDIIFSKVIDKARISDDKSFCRLICGALHLPKGFQFADIIDSTVIEDRKSITKGYEEAQKTDNSELMSQVSIRAEQAMVQYYKRSYKTASTIIRSAPDRIYFHY